MESGNETHALCDACFKSVQHEGEARGTFEEIGGVPTYIANPPKGYNVKGIILYYSDVYAVTYINNKLVMDYFAGQGFIVLGIDYFFGDSASKYNIMDPSFDRHGWVGKHIAKALEVTPGWLRAVKERYGTDKKYGAAGYCFGAPFVMKDGSEGNITAAAIIHPSRLEGDHFKDINVPILMSCAEVDAMFPAEKRRLAEDILQGQKDYYIQVFSGVEHGFGSRSDLTNERQLFAKEECARGIVAWFTRYLN